MVCQTRAWCVKPVIYWYVEGLPVLSLRAHARAKFPNQLLHRCSKTCDWMGVYIPISQAISQEFRYMERGEPSIPEGNHESPSAKRSQEDTDTECNEPTIPNENPESWSAK